MSLGAALGVLCLLAAAGALLFDLRPLIFRSGSMEPAIGTGALAVAREVPASSVQIGDVVSVVAASGARITHRVVRVDAGADQGASVTLTLRGDANARPDAESYRVDRVGLVLWHVPKVGYVVSWFQHPAVIFLCGMLVGILGMVAFWSRGRDPDSPDDDPDDLDPPQSGRRRGRRGGTKTQARRALRSGALVMAGIVTIGVVNTARGTQAAFTDTGRATSGSFAAAAPAPGPTLNCGSLGLLSVTFTWPSVAGADGYSLVLTSSGGSERKFEMTAGQTNRTVTSSLAETGTAVLRVKYRYPVGAPETTWYSAESNIRNYEFILFALGVCN